MNRKQLYKEITTLNLQDEIKRRYGKNYTQCTNSSLLRVVNEVQKSMKHHESSSCVNCENRLAKLVQILQKKRILLVSEVDSILKG